MLGPYIAKGFGSEAALKIDPVTAIIVQMPNTMQQKYANQATTNVHLTELLSPFSMSLIKVILRARIPVESVISCLASSFAELNPDSASIRFAFLICKKE